MLGFDLVPSGYRAEMRVRRWTRTFLGVLLISVVLIAIARTGLAIVMTQSQEQVTALKAKSDEITKQRAELNVLTGQQADYDYRASVVAANHATPGPRALLQLIDETITDQARITKLALSNQSEHTDKEIRAQEGVAVVSSSTNAKKWRFYTDLTIAGQARKHSVLYDFVNRLQAHPLVAQVNVEKNSLRRYEEANIVDFEIKVRLRRTS